MYANSTTTNLLISGLKPFTVYKFRVMVVEGQKASDYSLETRIETLEAGN